MMQEEHTDRNEPLNKHFQERIVQEFSLFDSNVNFYKYTQLEVLATIIIMLSTISGGFLEGYSSPVISSLLDSNASDEYISGNSSLDEINTDLIWPNTKMVLNESVILNSTASLIKNIKNNGTSSTINNEVQNESLPTEQSYEINIISMHFTKEQASWFGSLLLFGAFIGAVVSSVVMRLGRRNAILLSSFPRFIGWLLIIVAPSIFALNFGRFLTGFSIGIVTSAGPIYISEITHSSKRGAFSCFIQLGVNLGIFLAALLGAALAWKALAVCGAISVLIYGIPTFNIPKSPYWLVLQDRDDAAKYALKSLRPKDYDIDAEFAQIKSVAQNMKRNKEMSWMELITERRCVLPLFLVLLVTGVNRFSGYNAVISYCSTFLHHAVPTISSTWTAVAVCFIQVLATILSIFIVDVWGRRKLLISSIAVMAISLIAIALNDTFGIYGTPWIAVSCTISYVAAYSIGLGPLTLVILGEMLPLDARDKGSAIVASVNWLVAFIVTKTFFSWETLVGISGVCWTYSMVCVIGGIFVYLLIPETKGCTLSEIEAHFNYSRGRLFVRPKMDRTISSIIDHDFNTIDSYSTFS